MRGNVDLRKGTLEIKQKYSEIYQSITEFSLFNEIRISSKTPEAKLEDVLENYRENVVQEMFQVLVKMKEISLNSNISDAINFFEHHKFICYSMRRVIGHIRYMNESGEKMDKPNDKIRTLRDLAKVDFSKVDHTSIFRVGQFYVDKTERFVTQTLEYFFSTDSTSN